MKRKIIAGFLVLAIGIVGAFAFVQPASAPEVRFAALSGESFSTADLRGRVVLVNFWATYCVTCIKEMPKMVETYKKFAPRGYEVVAVAVKSDHPNRVAEFTRRRALPFKVALDTSGELAREFGNVRITPMSFLIDKQGRVLKKYVGEPDWTELHSLVAKALGDPA